MNRCGLGCRHNVYVIVYYIGLPPFNSNENHLCMCPYCEYHHLLYSITAPRKQVNPCWAYYQPSMHMSINDDYSINRHIGQMPRAVKCQSKVSHLSSVLWVKPKLFILNPPLPSSSLHLEGFINTLMLGKPHIIRQMPGAVKCQLNVIQLPCGIWVKAFLLHIESTPLAPFHQNDFISVSS